MDCEGITEDILDFRSRLQKLVLLESPEEILEQQQILKEKMESYLEENSPEKVFIKALSEPERWQRVKDLITDRRFKKVFFRGKLSNLIEWGKGLNSPDRLRAMVCLFAEIKKVFSDINCIGGITSGRYEWFASEMFDDPQIREAKESQGCINPILTKLVNSVFISLFLRDGDILRIERLPNDLNTNFGILLDRGHISLKESLFAAGFALNGAQLDIDKACSNLGEMMISGRINCASSNYQVIGQDMVGGRIIIGDAQLDPMRPPISGEIKADRLDGINERCQATLILNGFDRNRQSPKIATTAYILKGDRERNVYVGDKSVILAEKNHVMDTPSFVYIGKKNKKDKGSSIIRHSHSSIFGDYTRDKGRDNKIPRLIESRFDLLASDYRHELIIIKNLEGLEGLNIFKGMKSGIIVLRDIPEEIGDGMSGGIVILEKEGLTVEEARRRISSGKKGGFVLLKVKHPTLVGITTLVDVEG